MSSVILDIIIRSLIGQDFYDTAGAELRDIFKSMEHEFGSIWLIVLPSWIPCRAALRLRAFRARIQEIFEQRLAVRENDVNDTGDYVGFFLEDKATQPFRHLLSSHFTLLVWAAHSSSVANIAWNFIEVSFTHP